MKAGLPWIAWTLSGRLSAALIVLMGTASFGLRAAQPHGEAAPAAPGAKLLPAPAAGASAHGGPEAGEPPEGSEATTSRVPANSLDALHSPNLVAPQSHGKVEGQKRDFQQEIETARVLRREHEHAAADRLLLNLLEEKLPSEFRRAAMFELAMVAQDRNQLGRAQQILAQYLTLFPGDPSVPEVLLRQGLLYRQMGANSMAVTKFYAVMNSALGMQVDQFDYYKRLVLQAQTEIADTYYQQGKLTESVDFYKRILKQNAVELNRPQVHFKLIRCLTGLGRHMEAVVESEIFFEKYPSVPETPELRFLCAESLRQLGRRRDAMMQVLSLLAAESQSARTSPENWTYWQQKAGNQVANELYKEGDYLSALEIYNRMAALNTNVTWQVPVLYQAGLIYEHLQQPAEALQRFDRILSRQAEAPPDDTSLATVFQMARWRKDNMGWQNRAEVAIQALKLPSLKPSTNPPAIPPTTPPPNRATRARLPATKAAK